MEKDYNTEFPITIYGNFEKYSDVISKARCRIFYKYANRNATYITDEFADKLLQTVPYTPVKGIFNSENADYEDHGNGRTQGRIYGVVPENPNLAWELHEDEDGVLREYACVDVLIYTGLYEEASQIKDKSLSMELYAPSISGEWKIIEGKKLLVFTEGRFLGLQVLGDQVEPCFEGAGFYELQASFETFMAEVREYSKNFQKEEGGQKGMSKFNFKLSDSPIEAIWNLLNREKTEDGEPVIESVVASINDEYALVYHLETGEYERVYYIKKEESEDSEDTSLYEISSREKCYVADLTEEENSIIQSIKEKNEGTFEKADEIFERYSTLEGENVSLSEKVEALEAEIEMLKAGAEADKETYEKLSEEKESLEKEVDELNSYKLQVETAKKEAVLDKYADKLPEEELSPLREKLSEYTVLDLSKELAFLYVSSANFQVNDDPTQIYKDDHEMDAISAALSKYEKKV